ncbi:MAG: hypothetical protein WBW78_11760, partial [Terrimicrobiaceae bacterium]
QNATRSRKRELGPNACDCEITAETRVVIAKAVCDSTLQTRVRDDTRETLVSSLSSAGLGADIRPISAFSVLPQ